MKPRNKVMTDPLLKKGHAHKSIKDYDRKKEKDKAKKEIDQARRK